MRIRVKSRKLDYDERKLVRALYSEFLRICAEINVVDRQIMELMDRRDDLRDAAGKVSVKRIAEKFEVVPSHIVYLLREREPPKEAGTRHRSNYPRIDQPKRRSQECVT